MFFAQSGPPALDRDTPWSPWMSRWVMHRWPRSSSAWWCLVCRRHVAYEAGEVFLSGCYQRSLLFSVGRNVLSSSVVGGGLFLFRFDFFCTNEGSPYFKMQRSALFSCSLGSPFRNPDSCLAGREKIRAESFSLDPSQV